MEYPFGRGDPFDRRFDYAYSIYHGPEYLDCWRTSRQQAVKILNEKAEPVDPSNCSGTAGGWFAQMRKAFAQDDKGSMAVFDVVVRRFEVSKRIFNDYDSLGVPRDKSAYTDIGAYVDFGTLLSHRFQTTGHLPYLNALLKTLDICCASTQRVSSEDAQKLVATVQQEGAFVQALSN